MSIEVIPLAEADIPSAVDCLQKAFADDPYFCWAFDDPSKFNVQRNAASLGAHFRFGLGCGYPIYVAKVTRAASERKTERPITLPPGSVVGICWWSSPEVHPVHQTWSVWAQEWLLSFRQLMYNIRFAGRGGLNVRRYWIWKSMQTEAQKMQWTNPHGYYFCNMLGVSPQAQGMGVGKRLMDVVIQKADEEVIPCYLESSKGAPNIAIYERMGFELTGEIKCADGEDICKLYCMIRKPKLKA
ncbi:Acyl-CoA N-acyltransferase [Penicillium angulare]|uniref:Acyl-CoA N-acyltransferase n=1 Tax=Penicillium angulare TaxID=116970 RepID=UPI002540DD4A|nr:Acyl-CoA N-acyltransferase [Penicillium angulare]KAJ5287834.1 Acyl-CoA N-acyltransferase [Penicillium angulare]